jgi:hypothetical protein
MTDRPQPPDHGADPRRPPPQPHAPATGRRGGRQRQGLAEAAIKSLIRSIAGSLGRAIARALTGRR